MLSVVKVLEEQQQVLGVLMWGLKGRQSVWGFQGISFPRFRLLAAPRSRLRLVLAQGAI